MYINVHSHYSLRYGILSPEELLDFNLSFGIESAILTDINNTSACLDFIRHAQIKNIKPIVGIDFRNNAEQQYVGIAINNNGFKELNDHLSHHLHQKKEFESIAPVFHHVFIIYPYSKHDHKQPLRENEFIGLNSSELLRLDLDKKSIAKNKLVSLQTASFRNKADYNTHRLLRAVDCNSLLSTLPKDQQGSPKDLFHSPKETLELFASKPFILENTKKLLNQCSIHFIFNDVEQNHNQSSYTNSKEEDFELMKEICQKNLLYRYPKPTEQVRLRLNKELKIIKEKNFVSYFLINWRILEYARSKGYYYIGRGSGANSVVAYLMRITDVDPIDLDLYFERFINLYRQNPPDFDIDFSWTDRDDITHFIFNNFPHVSLLGTYVTFKFRAAIREIGKVFGLPKDNIDLLASGHFNYSSLDEINQLVVKYSERIQGFPNHLSIHAGGILIADRPIHHFCSTHMPPKGFPTTQFDMVIAEDVGLYKFDILSQRGLGKIKDALQIIAYNQPEKAKIDIHDFHSIKTNPDVNKLLRTARAIGCFYVESPAMRMLMKKMRVDNYLGLVAASSVIRPGVAKSGMMRTFVDRYRNKEKRKEAHPIMMEIMPETYGVMVYQEDVIKVAHYYAGLDLGEADVLRRGMSGKYRSREEFQRAKAKFFSNCKKKGYKDADTAEIWRQTESFAGYAFAKGHSASYAVESYQSLYLKAYFPLEYMVATLNNGGGFYSREHYLHEARMHGGIVQAPCVNKSIGPVFISGKNIFIGLNMINSLESKLILRLVEERKKNGPYTSFDNLTERISISLEQAILLVKAGTFRFTGKGKKELLWRAYFILGHQKKSEPQASLFTEAPKNYKLPNLNMEKHEDAFHEYELLGFPLCNPFELLESELPSHLLSRELPSFLEKKVSVAGYLVHTKSTSTSRGKRMQFGTLIDCEGEYLDTVHFPNYKNDHFLTGRGIYKVTGIVKEEFGHYSIEVLSAEKLAIIPDPRYAESAHKQLSNAPKHIKNKGSSRADFIKRKKSEGLANT